MTQLIFIFIYLFVSLKEKGIPLLFKCQKYQSSIFPRDLFLGPVNNPSVISVHSSSTTL